VSGKKGYLKTSSKKAKPWLLLAVGLPTTAMMSATLGAIVAFSLSSTPLLQSKLSDSPTETLTPSSTIATSNLQLPQLTRPVNILVLGTKVLTTDLKTNPEPNLNYQALVNSFEGLSDTMLLVRFDPVSRKVTILSIPRDTQTEIEGKGTVKINEANAVGGAALAVKTVSNLLGGVQIDRYIRVNVQSIEKFIDAIGGVNMYVPKDMKYNDFSQHFYVDLKAGQQHLDGEKVVQFLRFRHDEYGDIGRIQRQQLLMRAVTEQVLNPQILMKIPTILNVIKENIDSNLTLEELLALSGTVYQTQRSQVQMLLLPGNFNDNGRRSISYWLPDTEKIQNLMARYFELGETDLASEDTTNIKIALQNGTDDPNAPRQVMESLQKAGYSRISIGNPTSEPLAVTRVIAQTGDERGANLLQSGLGIGEVFVESTGNLNSDVTIQIGRDWQAKPLNTP
jgi:LCP family protein required for cell wall assembly